MACYLCLDRRRVVECLREDATGIMFGCHVKPAPLGASPVDAHHCPECNATTPPPRSSAQTQPIQLPRTTRL